MCVKKILFDSAKHKNIVFAETGFQFFVLNSFVSTSLQVLLKIIGDIWEISTLYLMIICFFFF